MTAAALPDALRDFTDLIPDGVGQRLALFLDFDGTLAPLVERPEDAALAPAAEAPLRRLAALVPVALVSGRDVEDLRPRVPIDGLTLAGSHGYTILGPDGSLLDVGDDYAPDLDRAEAALNDRLGHEPGILVERKRAAIAVHYRNAGPGGRATVEAAVTDAIEGGDRLKPAPGKMIVEVRPTLDWDKGAAVRWLLETWQDRLKAPPFPVYIGDDRTDEDAIRTLPPEGLGIIVGGPDFTTTARARLDDTGAVARFLERLADVLRVR